MNILFRSRALLSPVFQKAVISDRAGGFRCVCSLTKAKNHSLHSPPLCPVKAASCQPSVASFNFQLHTKRCFSDGSDSRNPDRNDGIEEGSQDMDDGYRDNSSERHKSPQTFTLDVLVSLLRQENAVDLCVIKVPENVQYTDYFIVVSGVSPRHLRAMALYAIKVYKFLKKAEDPDVKIEGRNSEDWTCIDFGNIVVHFMLPETREIYELEKLWLLGAYDEQLQSIPEETLPEDFILDVEDTK